MMRRLIADPDDLNGRSPVQDELSCGFRVELRARTWHGWVVVNWEVSLLPRQNAYCTIGLVTRTLAWLRVWDGLFGPGYEFEGLE